MSSRRRSGPARRGGRGCPRARHMYRTYWILPYARAPFLREHSQCLLRDKAAGCACRHALLCSVSASFCSTHFVILFMCRGAMTGMPRNPISCFSMPMESNPWDFMPLSAFTLYLTPPDLSSPRTGKLCPKCHCIPRGERLFFEGAKSSIFRRF